MDFTGSMVDHAAFGKGVVTGVKENIISVSFSHEEKKFLFPDSFAHFLCFEDPEKQTQVKGILQLKEREENSIKESFRVSHERLQRLRSLKISPNSQGAFGLVSNTPEEIFATWSVFTGRYLGGYSKGEPRIPSRLAPNSLCLITFLPVGKPEKERKIIGAFMVRDDFYGTSCSDGIIKGHENYRIRLQENETPYFWNYFDTGETPPSWGSVEIKYCSNLVVRKILYDIMTSAEESQDYDDIARLYRYYCRINRLDEKPKTEKKKGEAPKSSH